VANYLFPVNFFAPACQDQPITSSPATILSPSPQPQTPKTQVQAMRLQYVEPESPVTDAIRLRRGGELTELDRALLHSLPIAAGWNVLLGAVRTQTSISADLRELAICRVAALNSAWFEWKHHYPLALEAGLTDPLMQLVKKGEAWDLSGMEDLECGTLRWTVLRYVDSMTLKVKVPDDVFDDLRAWWSDREIIELTTIIASYNMVSRFLVALDVGEMNGKN
jgi:alkylhydroperoxidase family enzyme